jgi:hypothetical protein
MEGFESNSEIILLVEDLFSNQLKNDKEEYFPNFNKKR